jgi:hypothetical protein
MKYQRLHRAKVHDFAADNSFRYYQGLDEKTARPLNLLTGKPILPAYDSEKKWRRHVSATCRRHCKRGTFSQTKRAETIRQMNKKIKH